MLEAGIYEKQKNDNIKAYERLKNEISHQYPGNYVAICKGQVLLTAPTYQEAWGKLKEVAPDAQHFLIFPADKKPFLETVKVR